MLTGWKDITAHVGLSVNSIKRLMSSEGFPVQYLQGKPCATEDMIGDWLRDRFEAQSQKARQ